MPIGGNSFLRWDCERARVAAHSAKAAPGMAPQDAIEVRLCTSVHVQLAQNCLIFIAEHRNVIVD